VLDAETQVSDSAHHVKVKKATRRASVESKDTAYDAAMKIRAGKQKPIVKYEGNIAVLIYLF
jgi:hypothetical protein